MSAEVEPRSESEPGFIQRYWRWILASFLGWSLVAAIPVTSSYLGAGAPGFSVWWAIFKKIGAYYYMWGLTTPLLYRLSSALPYQGRGLFLSVPVHLLVMLALSFLFGFIVHAESWREWLFGFRAPGYHAMSFFTYALIVLCSLAVKFYRLSLLRQRQVTEARIQAVQLDNKLNLARVDSLRMQMNPHFLFNALNSVAALIESEQKDRAYDALERLGELLRLSLQLSKEKDISLEQEISFCRAYLAMEKIRFDDRLHTRWKLEEASLPLQVPAFVLQPCVENAVKHAVSVSTDPVTITIASELRESALVLVVRDNGQAQSRSAVAGGLGISNLTERLRLRYGAAAKVQCESIAGGGFQARLTIPI